MSRAKRMGRLALFTPRAATAPMATVPAQPPTPRPPPAAPRSERDRGRRQRSPTSTRHRSRRAGSSASPRNCRAEHLRRLSRPRPGSSEPSLERAPGITAPAGTRRRRGCSRQTPGSGRPEQHRVGWTTAVSERVTSAPVERQPRCISAGSRARLGLAALNITSGSVRHRLVAGACGGLVFGIDRRDS